MAIEIRQLVIRAVVDGGARSDSPTEQHRAAMLAGLDGQPPGSRDTAGKPAAVETPIELGADERQAIVNACVREVLRKLERARER